jgi:ubiquinone/menaquinone biosynthesis C-methylase UbiE
MIWNPLRRAQTSESTAYSGRVRQELSTYNEKTDVHDLPQIFHYVSNKYWRPRFEALGIRGINEFYADCICALSAQRGRRIDVCSVGAGNCDTEVAIARLVKDRDVDLRFTCLDLNPQMLARGKSLATEQGLSCFVFTEADINQWRVEPRSFDVVMANHSLHHFLELEVLFDKISEALRPDGSFLTMDMIGRNGHMRWPEALDVVNRIWSFLPDRYKHNHQLNRVETVYENWDCSREGFEGIRAQDILPLLMGRFDFELFLAFGNIVDIFIDRGFGPNFREDSDQDRAIIDLIATLDEYLIDQGTVKPCHLVAALRPKGAVREYGLQTRCFRHLTPEFCVRPVE